MNNLITTGKAALFACSPVLLDVLHPKLDNVIIVKEELLIVLIIIAIMYQSVSLFKAVFNKKDEKPPSNPSAGDLL